VSKTRDSRESRGVRPWTRGNQGGLSRHQGVDHGLEGNKGYLDTRPLAVLSVGRRQDVTFVHIWRDGERERERERDRERDRERETERASSRRMDEHVISLLTDSNRRCA
jgi:hypothetical protein